jgi:RNA polymerase primary sigma factor
MRDHSEFDDLALLLRQMRSHPPFDRKTELVVTRKSRKGNKHAQEQLVLHNLGLVISVARKFMGRGVRLEDLVQEGNYGLLKAIKHFNPEKGNRFSTYAVWWIKSYIMRSLKDGPSAVRRTMPDGGLPPRDISLEESPDHNGESTHMDRLSDEEPLPDEQFMRLEEDTFLHNQLDKVRGRIGELGWDILNGRLTQDKQDEPRTLAEIGNDWGLSRERVRQVEVITRRFLTRHLAKLDPNNQGGSALAKKVGGK